MSTLSDNMIAIKARIAEVLAFRAAVTVDALVTIKGIEGTHRVCSVPAHRPGFVCAVKQDAVAIKRAPGAGAKPNDRGPGRYYAVSRLYPVPV